LGDRRHQNPGCAARVLLDADQREELRAVLKGPPSDGGLCSRRSCAGPLLGPELSLQHQLDRS